MRDFVSYRWVGPGASILSMSILTWIFWRPVPAEVPGDLLGLMTLAVAVLVGMGTSRAIPRRIPVGAGPPVPTPTLRGRS